ncbi:hypothetical protein BFL35_16425 (plasmid) [Clavibacter michiganensis]|nr:hypothetical protein BFL35_16425 [Clavibacter michiganensis]
MGPEPDIRSIIGVHVEESTGPLAAVHREQLATDFNDLQAVDGPTNEAKSDQGPATWLPPAAGYDCLYVTRFA